jgi:hypothetical protein
VAVPTASVLTASRRPARWYLLRLALVVSLAVLGLQLLLLSDPHRTEPDDFISSWAAGRLLVQGRNPYDGEQVLAVQRTANWTKDIPYRVWYPPWAMPILGVFGLLPYTSGRFLWYLVNIAACLASADLLWRYFRGPPQLRAVVLPLIFTFWPAVIAIRTGQISALVLLGVVGFLALGERRRWLAAGACLPLVAIKPQLLHLFWIAVLLWSLRGRRWPVLAGAAASTLLLTAVATAADPPVISQFLYMATHEAPQAPASTLGTLLRMLVAMATGAQHFWLQFLPPVLSLAWFLPYFWRRRAHWDWEKEAPIVLVAALATTAYGWIYDQIVFLVPVVQVAASIARTGTLAGQREVVAGYLAINAAILVVNVIDVSAFSYIWVPFAFGGWWLAARRS